MTLTFGQLPDYGTFERLFKDACPDGTYTARAGLSGLFQGTPHALSFGDAVSYNCLALFDVLEACVKAGAEQEDAAPSPSIEWPQCLQDASDVLATLGVEWV